jgi:large subunit ribosomal protein L32
MAVPKRKISKTRKRKRRAHSRIKAPGLARCPRCGEPVMPHRACPHCGYYKDTKVIETE